MKTSEVKIGQVYNVKVSGKVVAVRLTEEKWSGDKHVGWVGTNTETGRAVRVKSVRKLRGLVKTKVPSPRVQENETVMVLWHPEGKPVEVLPVRVYGAGNAAGYRIYAKSGGGDWWALSDPEPKDGWRVGSVQVRSPGRIAALEQEYARLQALAAPAPVVEIETRGDAAMTAEACDAPDAPPAPSDPAPANVGEPAANGAAKPRKARAPKATAATVGHSREQSEAKPRKLSGLDAAAQVLAAATEPMTVNQILEAITSKGLWSSPSGKTPGATINAAMLREIATKGRASRFQKTGRGLFAAVPQAVTA